MMNLNDRKTRQHFNNLAPEWDRRMNYPGERIESLLSRLAIHRANCILDLGCGTGVIFPALKKLAQPGARVYAIDYAAEMAAVAASKNYESISPFCADVHHLPFRHEKFDIIIAFQVFPHFADTAVALRECWRVLKNGGELSIIHLRSSAELNTFHETLHSPVKNHRLIRGNQLGDLLQTLDYTVETINDAPGEYFVRAVKFNRN
ncbi:MAG: class I SAM-dependent methyltransferase [Candidatus Zhuqueibacterota bacterium]